MRLPDVSEGIAEVIVPSGDVLDDFSRRKGRFLVTYDLLKSSDIDHRVLQGIFSHFLVLKSISHLDRECVEYSALSALFDAVGEGLRIPMYNIQIGRQDEGIRWDGEGDIYKYLIRVAKVKQADEDDPKSAMSVKAAGRGGRPLRMIDV